MSFSSEIKNELEALHTKSRHCQIAELAALFCHCGHLKVLPGVTELHFHNDNNAVLAKAYSLCRRTFGVAEDDIFTVRDGFYVDEPEAVRRMAEAIKLIGDGKEYDAVPGLLLGRSCCKRAFLRGSFLSCGSLSDPEKGYHLEFVCDSEKQAFQIQKELSYFEIEAKIIARKKYFVVYMKEGAAITLLLNVIEAHNALMSLENLRIVKEVRNSVNRRVNCEAANITKTINAAAKQVEDIRKIERIMGLKALPSTLREMAQVRIEYPDATLAELGQYLTKPVGKSGVNHRLRKLSEIADRLSQ